ncbi:MAG: hypothetical protein KatS3mg068_2198 [Candidatus Sericytochromatia bacterium]|nr:MAG: hypothetical protein KatS3mg068_2198 [Candidatus Sericytochromatia bacterium]
MSKLYLQDIVKSIKFENLPNEWQTLDLESFSDNKNLFDYQQNALKNSLIALYLYFKEYNIDKKEFF